MTGTTARTGRRTRLWATMMLALGTTCQPPAPSEADGPAPHVAPPTTLVPAADPEAVDPVIAAPGPLVARATEAIASGALDEARAAIAHAPDAEAAIIRYRLARAYLEAGSPEAAIPLLAEVVTGAGPLALHARVLLARSTTDLAVRRDMAAPACARDWPGRADACALVALATDPASDDAAAQLDAALAQGDALSFDDRAAVVRARAELLAASDDEADHERAIAMLRSLGDARPGARVVEEADARADALVAALPTARRRALSALPVERALARADAIARTNAHVEAEHAYHAIAAATHAGDPTHCAALLGEGRSMYRRRARSEAAAFLDTVAERCRADADVRAWAQYFAAKSYSALGQDAQAIARYDALADDAPSHRLADDARYEAAAIELRGGEIDAARTHLSALLAGPLDADMRPDAHFLLGWTERAGGHLDAALAAFDAALAEGPSEVREDLVGRVAYWRARTLGELGRHDEARAALESIARERPLSYYGRHARGRLAELGLTLDDPRVAPAPLTFRARAETRTEGFARAIALLRAGDAAAAERELAALNLVDASAPDEDARWLTVALLAEAGAHDRAVTRARGPHLRALLARPIDGRGRALFALAYPRGYAELVEPSATEAAIPSALVFGLIREESSFTPSVVSIAHAYGLMQLIRPTATRLARPLGLHADPASLVTPEVNVRLGTRYLGELTRHFDGGAELVPAAYNAGQGAVDRWLRERGDRPLDEFVESIPYAETRGYTRRVLQSWGVYAFLETGRVEALPATITR